MLGISYGQLLLLIGAVVAFTGPKDFPRVSRLAGRMAGRAIGYVQLARGQFDVIMQQSQAQQVHKELKDTMAQLEAIRHEIRTVSFMNPGQLTTRLVDNLDLTTASNESTKSGKGKEENTFRTATHKANYLQDSSLNASSSFDIQSKATAYSSLAESSALNSGSRTSKVIDEISDNSGLLAVLPVSAESAGLLPNRKENVCGSDLVWEAIVEAEVANNAKEFFAQPQSQMKPE